MKIRIEGTPRGVEAFTAFLRATIDVRQESQDYDNRPPSTLVRRYIDAELSENAAAKPSPLMMATEAKRLRDLAAEISILQRADADLAAQPWIPLQSGDIVLVGYDSAELGTTYLADGDDTHHGPELRLISASQEITGQQWPVSVYELWFEAGPASLTVIRAGKVVFGQPRTAKAAG